MIAGFIKSFLGTRHIICMISLTPHNLEDRDTAHSVFMAFHFLLHNTYILFRTIYCQMAFLSMCGFAHSVKWPAPCVSSCLTPLPGYDGGCTHGKQTLFNVFPKVSWLIR